MCPDITIPIPFIYLIKKKEDNLNLHSINITNPAIIIPCTSLIDLDFSMGFNDINVIYTDSINGKPIDKIIDTFSIYRKEDKTINISLFE